MTDVLEIRLLLKRGNTVSDVLYDADPSDFGGHVPFVGDRIVQFLKGKNDGYRVVERIFEMGGRSKYVSLVVEDANLGDLADLPRFMDTPRT